MNTTDAGRLGGTARAARMTPEERSAAASAAARAKWAGMSAKKRSAHARMMAKSRRKKGGQDACSDS